MTEDEKMVFTAQIERTKSQADIQSAHNQELETVGKKRKLILAYR